MWRKQSKGRPLKGTISLPLSLVSFQKLVIGSGLNPVDLKVISPRLILSRSFHTDFHTEKGICNTAALR